MVIIFVTEVAKLSVQITTISCMHTVQTSEYRYNTCIHTCTHHTYIHTYIHTRDLQYISIRQYIDTLIEYRIVILCSMNIEISDGAECMFHVVNITF